MRKLKYKEVGVLSEGIRKKQRRNNKEKFQKSSLRRKH